MDMTKTETNNTEMATAPSRRSRSVGRATLVVMIATIAMFFVGMYFLPNLEFWQSLGMNGTPESKDVRIRANGGVPKSADSSVNSSGDSRPVLLAEGVPVVAARGGGSVIISGQIEPVAVAMIAAEVSARVVSRPVQRGDAVPMGRALVVMDDASARATLDQAIAAQSQASAALRQLQQDYGRIATETQAAQEQAKAQLSQAQAGEKKTRSATRDQELRQAESSLKQAQTDENLARIEAERYRRLVDQGAVARQVLDQRQAVLDVAISRRESAEQAVSLAREGARQEDIAAATAQTESARAAVLSAASRPARLASIQEQIAALKAQEEQSAAAVRAARIALGKHVIHAPFPARILETRVEVGEMTSPGSPALKIGDIRQVKAVFAVPESSRVLLQEGKAISISADAVRGKTFLGRVRTIGYEADSRSRTFPVEITVSNAGEILLPGMVARLSLAEAPRKDIVVAPLSSVASDEVGSYVIALKDGVAVRRAVTIGAPAGTDAVEIVSGLTSGEVIAKTPQRLTGGAKIRLATATDRP
jgi:hypothetical protein